MKIKTQDYEDVTVVEMSGELDTDIVDLFKQTIVNIVEKGSKGIVLDMGNVGFVDSDGLEHLLWARDYCCQNNCQLRLAAIEEAFSEILKVTRLKNEFDRFVELSEAVKSFV
jgi:anti-anti-sigma factor